VSIELSRATFRRLVQLYLLSIALVFGAVIFEWLSPKWSAFDSEFVALSEKHFGTLNFGQGVLIALGVYVLALLAWGIASTVGLLWFKRWARFGFWASAAAFVPVIYVPGFYPYYSAPLSDLAGMIGSALFGAILILAYSRDYGASWFAEKPNKG
jgi:hypothetical protein